MQSAVKTSIPIPCDACVNLGTLLHIFISPHRTNGHLMLAQLTSCAIYLMVCGEFSHSDTGKPCDLPIPPPWTLIR